MDVQYKIIGAGSSSENRIVLNAGCGVDSMSLCWTLRVEDDDQCGNVMYYDEQYCSVVTTTSSVESSFKWTDPYDDQVNPTREHTIYYTVVKESCPQPPEDCDEECLGVTAYAEPYYVTSEYGGDINIHYECDLNCYVKRGVTSVPFSIFTESGDDIYVYDFKPEGYVCSTEVYLKRKDDEKCDSGETADISITFSEKELPAYSGSVNVIVSYRKTTTKEDCSKKTVNGYFTLPWTVVCESSSTDTYRCCKDHYVTSAITVADIRQKAHIDSSSTIYYNGQPVTTSAITYSILQKAKYTEECEGFCEDKTTYCVDSGSVKVQYETSYMSDNWHDATDADILPFTGGRIKVIWDYTSYTSGCTSKPYSGSGEWEEIIVIGGCDERPTDCNSDYNKVITGYTDDNPPIPLYAIYDDETYQGCAICDSECCYECGSDDICIGKCVILFKEQTPSCTTCDYCDVWDDLEGRLIRYNKIRYSFRQDCHQECEAVTTRTYNKVVKEVDCDATSAATSVTYTEVTEYVGGFGCPSAVTRTGSEDVSLEIAKQNTSHSNLVLLDDEKWTVIQLSGETCAKESYCDCESLVLDTDCDQYEYTYGIVNMDCNEHQNYLAYVPYTATCNGAEVEKASSGVTIPYVPCNTGPSTSYTINGITVRQDGNCSCDGNCADGLKANTELNGYLDKIVNNNSDIPFSISVNGTPCTYKYLKQVYEYAKGKISTSIPTNEQQWQMSWVLANAMSEITPVSGWATSYFVYAASSYGGNQLDPNNYQHVYNVRTSGATYYAMYKHDNGTASDALAAKARTELHNINHNVPDGLKSKTNAQWSSEPEFVRLTDLIPTQVPTNHSASTSNDYTVTQADIQGNPNGTEEAIRDKNLNDDYLLGPYVLNIGTKYTSLLEYTCDNFTAQSNGLVKWDKDYERMRPGAQQKLFPVSEKFNLYGGKVYIASDAKDYYSYASCCGSCDGGRPAGNCRDLPQERCQQEGCGCSDDPCTNYKAGDNPYNPEATSCSADCSASQSLGIGDMYPCQGMNSHQSYPSGHSMKAFFAFLVCTQTAGCSDKQDRINRYCRNRVVVRAHWLTDVIVGKYNASMQIGFMNGFQQYKDEVYKSR